MAQQASVPFALASRRLRTALQTLTFTGAAQQQRVDMLQVGYLSKVYVQLYGTIVCGAGFAGAFSNYFPGNILSKIVLRSNEGLEIYNSGGYGNLNHVQPVYEMGFNPAQQISPIGSDPIAATKIVTSSGMRTGVAAAPAPGTALSATTFNVCVNYMIPVAADDRLSAGLFLLQNQSTRVSLELQTNNLNGNGGINGILNAAGVLGAAGAISLTARVVMEYFSVPADPGSQPDTSYIHRWIEDNTSWVNSGEQLYKVPVNGIISRLLVDVENNGAQQPWFSTAGNPNTSNVGNMSVQYAASQTTEQYDQMVAMYMMRRDYIQDMPDGFMAFELSHGGGNVLQGWNGRDVYDTSALTELAFRNVINVAPTSGKIRYTRQELQRRGS